MSDQQKPVDLESIRARAEAATPGPWYDNGYCGIFSDHKQEAFGIASIWHERLYGDIPTDQGIADREFITQCRQDVPALCNEVEALRIRIRQLEGPLVPLTIYAEPIPPEPVAAITGQQSNRMGKTLREAANFCRKNGVEMDPNLVIQCIDDINSTEPVGMTEEEYNRALENLNTDEIVNITENGESAFIEAYLGMEEFQTILRMMDYKKRLWEAKQKEQG